MGYGRNLDDRGIDEEEAEFLLANDVQRAIRQLDQALPWWRGLDEARRGVLVNMVVNMGLGGLVGKNPKVLAACERGDYQTAAAEMLDGPWKNQVGDRARRLAAQMRSGEWTP